MELEQQICEQVIKRLDLDEESLNGFTNDTNLFDRGNGEPNLGLDSIDALELISLLYENWQIDVPTEDVKKLYSVNSIAEYIRTFKKD